MSDNENFLYGYNYDKKNVVFSSIYTDDIISSGKNENVINEVKIKFLAIIKLIEILSIFLDSTSILAEKKRSKSIKVIDH